MKRNTPSFILFLILGTTPVVNADIILSAPPRETPEDGVKIYQPLARHLTQVIGKDVVYEHPLNWRQYEKNMKKDVYDIVFDGPHFAAWRIDSLRAQPIMKLRGALRFVLVVPRANNEIKSIKQLVGQKICTLPAPNLGALTLFSMFPHPARQPNYHLVKGGFKAVALALQNTQCDGAILRSAYYYKKASQEFRNQTRVIRHSETMTNQGITVSKRINKELQTKIVNSLIEESGKLATQAILDRFAGSNGAFIPSTKQDYTDQNLLRDNVIYGW